MPTLHAVILAGGAGTRFWPASRRRLPKQFLAIGSKRSLIGETSDRLKGLVPIERQIVVSGEEHVDLVRKALRRLPPENVLAEPVGRNTAACVAWAALEIARREPDSVQAVLPSDHVIRPAKAFRAALAAAAAEADASGSLVTFGVKPTFAATGYGYIECGDARPDRDGHAVRSVARFVEKPDRARAEEFLRRGSFLWNSGMFVWTTRAIVRALESHAQEVVGPLARARSVDEVRARYASLPSVSIDVAVLEKAADVRVLPAPFEWNDVGSWSAIPEVAPSDERGNCAVGGTTVVSEDASNCVVYGKKGEIVALVGVEGLVVVRAGDAVLVCPKDRAQDVKLVVARLAREGPGFA